MSKIEQTVNTTTRMVVAISEKRCGCYAHPCKDEYKRRLKGPIYHKHEGKNPKFQSRTLGDEASTHFLAQGG